MTYIKLKMQVMFKICCDKPNIDNLPHRFFMHYAELSDDDEQKCAQNDDVVDDDDVDDDDGDDEDHDEPEHAQKAYGKYFYRSLGG